MRVFAKTASLVFVCCIVHLVGEVPFANAALITVNFSGTVESVDAELAGTFSIGDTLTGSYTFESTTDARLGSTSTFAVFDALTALSFSINGYSASSTGAPEIQVDNDPPFPFVDRYGLTSRASEGLIGPDVDGNALTGFSFRMDDSSNTVFSDALVLPTNPSLADFDSSGFFVFFGAFGVSGSLTSLSVQDAAAVPEPTTLTMFCLGALGCAGAALRRRFRKVA